MNRSKIAIARKMAWLPVVTMLAAAVFLKGDGMRRIYEENSAKKQDFIYRLWRGNIRSAEYFLVEIPKQNSYGRIQFKVGVADNTLGSVKTVGEFAAEKGALVTINGGFFRKKDGTNLPYGVVIIDGKIVYVGSPYRKVRNAQTLAIMNDGTFRYYSSSTPDIDKMIGDGVRQAITGRLPIITKGAESDYDDTEGTFQVIGYDKKNYYIFTTGDGILMSEVAAFLLKKGLQEAYVLDGGGSVATNIRNEKINLNKNKGTAERKVATFIYAVK